ncbi:MAG: phosphatidate cytidylyltransferase [Alphaproteobacteria bacterium]|nr:MAG: phosphatidate cytidylyltransferase [Alphaproteobacteria bacterium]
MVRLHADVFKRVLASFVLMPITLTALYAGGVIATSFVALMFVICLCEVYSVLFLLRSRQSCILLSAWLLYLAISFTGVWRVINDLGSLYLIALTVLTWASDSGGYIVGNLVGGCKFAPYISPNKTWSGAFGSVVFVVVGCTLLVSFGGMDAFETPFHLVFFAIFVSALVQLGDLLESLFKRHLSLKDVSNIIPGHGGVVDRLDGLIMLFFVLGISFWFVPTKQVFCMMGIQSFCGA